MNVQPTSPQREPQRGDLDNLSARPWADGEIRYTIGESSLGLLLLAQSARGVCAVLLGDDHQVLRQDLGERFPDAMITEAREELRPLMEQVQRMLDTPSHALDVPVELRGTAFQQQVWQALREIPAGMTASYTEVARRIGHPKASRAVARACAANHLAVLIPCHRVVRSDGALSGYRWGIERKRALLEREAGAGSRENLTRR